MSELPVKKSRAKGRAVSIISIDPGGTTGLCVISIDASWIRGLGAPSWEGLGAAIRMKDAYQVGRDPKGFGKDDLDLDAALMPILANQPLHQHTGMRSEERFYDVMNGLGVGGDLAFAEAQEIVQLRQIAGLLENYPEAAIVIEDFTLRSQVRSRDLLAPDRLRLAITSNEILHGAGRTPFVQQPATAKTVATDERLKRAGLHFPGMPHATDAARHALTFLRNARQNESVRAAAFPKHFADAFDD